MHSHFHRVVATNHAQVVHELENVRLIDRVTERDVSRIAISHADKTLNANQWKAGFPAYQAAPVWSADSQPVNAQVFGLERGVAPRGEHLDELALIAEPEFIQQGGAESVYVLKSYALHGKVA